MEFLVQEAPTPEALLGQPRLGSATDVAAADVAVTVQSAGVSACDLSKAAVATATGSGARLAADSEIFSPALEHCTPGVGPRPGPGVTKPALAR